MTSLRVICGLGPPQSKILATPMCVGLQLSRKQQNINRKTTILVCCQQGWQYVNTVRPKLDQGVLQKFTVPNSHNVQKQIHHPYPTY